VTLRYDDPPERLRDACAQRLDLDPGRVGTIAVVRRSLDARSRGVPRRVYTVDVEAPIASDRISTLSGVTPVPEDVRHDPRPGSLELRGRPVVVGAGPAGLFAAMRLCELGYAPAVLERGQPVGQRSRDAAAFWRGGDPDPDSNVLFGEGGAGAFSDGKLTTRIKDPRKGDVIRHLLACGAPESIAFDSRAHVGTDLLPRILRRFRSRLIGSRAKVRFGVRVDGIVADDTMTGLVTNDGQIDANAVVLAIGHSARDTYEMLQRAGVAMEAKPFAVGVRAQHYQDVVDQASYGRYAGADGLDHPEYTLRCSRTNAGRAVYSFCVCPGGVAIPCATEPGAICCNGMSGSKRSGPHANGGIVAEATLADMPGDGPLAGIEFQRRLERAAFAAGGGSYALPMMSLRDFVQDRYRRRNPSRLAVRSFPRAEQTDLRPLLPERQLAAIRQACERFDRTIPGWLSESAVAFGVETRTSAPVRILRGESGESVSHPGLYPAGEGAGYAGGIVSAAVDGIRAAEALVASYARPS